MYNLDLKKEDYPIIIKPNMGHPVLINLKDYKDEKGIVNKQVFFKALIDTTQIFTYFFPGAAFQLFCVKKLNR